MLGKPELESSYMNNKSSSKKYSTTKFVLPDQQSGMSDESSAMDDTSVFVFSSKFT